LADIKRTDRQPCFFTNPLPGPGKYSFTILSIKIIAMKGAFFITLLLAGFFCSNAQIKPVFKTLRYEEDYSYLKNDSGRNWYKQTKYNALSKNQHSYLSFGGDIRYQFFHVKNEDWGDALVDKDGYLFSRFLVHTDFHAGNHFRAFIQLQSSLVNGKLSTSPVDENPLELHQAFIDIALNPFSKNKLLFRLGRQEFAYGSQRLIAVREGPNNRQSFDGAKSVFTSGNYKVDFFYSHYVKAKKKLFDDGFNKNSRFWGAYIVRNKFPFLQNVDLYYLGLWKRETVFDDGTGKEIRHSIGSRVWNNTGRIKYDIEGVYQFGKFAEKNIRAWTLSFNTAYKFSKTKLKPEIGLKTEWISGDAVYDDNKLQSFNPLFPRGGYFGLASLIGPANLFDIHPSLTLELTKKLSFDIDYDLFWRYSTNDGIYTPGVALIYSGKNNSHKPIGKQLTTDLVYIPNNFLYFRGEFTWFNAGSFLKTAGTGKDILFTGITAQLRF
jgi:hypothetical protein